MAPASLVLPLLARLNLPLKKSTSCSARFLDVAPPQTPVLLFPHVAGTSAYPGRRNGFTCRTASVIKVHRPIMSRHSNNIINIQVTPAPRDMTADMIGGCCGVCRAPAAWPFCAHVFPCCAYPEELEEARRESSYLVVRDNGIEFNNPCVSEAKLVGNVKWRGVLLSGVTAA